MNRRTNTYYCDVCQVVTESFSVYESHLRGYKHAMMIQGMNSEMIHNSVNLVDSRYSVSFQSHLKSQFSLAQGKVNVETPLTSEKIEIPELGETYCYSELRNAASYVHSAHSTMQSGINSQLEGAESFHHTMPENIYETGNEDAAADIDEFLKSILKMHSCRQIGSETKGLQKKRENNLRSCNQSRNKSESAVCTKKRKTPERRNESTSSDESVIDLVSSDESFIEHESNNIHKSSKHREFRKTRSVVHKYHAYDGKDFKVKRARIANETRLSAQLHPNRYPSPPPGVNRKIIGDVSIIQAVTEDLKYPCIGLDRIIEIRGLKETHYYCEVCDLQCPIRYILPHLENYRHRLESLKPFVPLIYESYSKQRQWEIEEKVNKISKTLAEMFGCGKIKVEKEYSNDGERFSSADKEKQRETKRHSSKKFQHSFSNRSTTVDLISDSESYKNMHDSAERNLMSSYHFSTNHNSMNEVTNTSRLDFSYSAHSLENNQQNMWYGDRSFFYDTNRFAQPSMLYCKVCNIRMCSGYNWEMHLAGGKHITNVKRARGELPFRRKPVIVPDARAALMDELDRIEEPVLGLDMMKETQDPDAPGPLYTCLLCFYNTTSMNIIDHILSLKHRIKYLENIEHPSLLAVKGKCNNQYNLYKIIRNICANVEAEQGRGYLRVYIRSAEYEYRPYTTRANRRSGLGHRAVQLYLKDTY